MDRKEKLKQFLLQNCTCVSGNININSTRNCSQQKVNHGKGKGIIMLGLGECKIEKYQAIDLDISILDNLYNDLLDIFTKD